MQSLNSSKDKKVVLNAMYYSKFKMGQEIMVSDLVWTVFAKYEAPVYPEEGIKTFKTFIAPDNIKNMVCDNGFEIYCCFENDKLVGVLAYRDMSHISLLFVHEEYHRRGIAKTLLCNALDELIASDKYITQITVNSSPYALDIYKSMGFIATSEIQQQNGLLFIPMVKNL
jgi:GNAT superfamily N-acetyltransferase